VPIEQTVVADGRTAMEFLANRYGAARFVVGGMCSGALNAQHICLADERVVAMWMLDGYAYPTALYHRDVLMRRTRKLVSWEPWKRAADAYFGLPSTASQSTTSGNSGTDDRKSIFYQDWPPLPIARREIEQLVDRGVRLLFVYTGGWSHFVDHRQFDEMFPSLRRRSQVTIVYYQHADHSYLATEDRASMIRQVCDFVAALPQPA
jgi:hypothetical protein